VMFEGNGCDFSKSFHLINDKRYDREIKPSRWRVEMKSQCSSVFEANMEFKFIQVDSHDVFGCFVHFINLSAYY